MNTDATCRALDAARESLERDGVDVRCVVLSVGIAGGLCIGVNWPRGQLRAAAQLAYETSELLEAQAREW